jgi:predicted transposase YdaD
MVLTTLIRSDGSDRARALLRQNPEGSADSRAIIEMITTIMAYKFTYLTREEVEAMLGIELQQTGFYKSAKAEGIVEGEQQGEQKGEVKVILKLLNQKFGERATDMQERIAGLSIAQLDALTESLLALSHLENLESWLDRNT